MSPPDTLLLDSAPLARQMAPRLCRWDPATGESCAWIHGLWQYLRLLGLASTPDHHAEFFLWALDSITGASRKPKLLVSGAADYAMLALAIKAFGMGNVRPDITVVDQCETPLMLNRWYAERAAHSVTTRCCDILDYPEHHSFDVLCTHSFFSEFPPGQRAAILQTWRRLLRPGGAAIIVNRLRPAVSPGPVGVTEEQARAFGAAVLQQARSLGSGLACDPQELAHDARIYMKRRISYPLQREEIVTLFENAGFTIQEIACGPVTVPVRHDVTGPTTPGGSEYARIVARSM